FIAFLLTSACGGRKNTGQETAPFVSDEGMVWNTQFHITYRGSAILKDSVRMVLDEVGHNLSVFDTASLVSRVNRQDSTPVNTDFIRVYAMSRRINKLTGGIFDPTLSPIITAWGFGPGHKATPDTARVDSLLRFVGINKTRLKYDSLIKDVSGVEFNFSAIAKGYGCDRVGEMFKRNGVKDFMVEIGGEVLASGVSPRGEGWNISIDRPIVSDSIVHESQVVISFTNQGLATSGNYRNYHGSVDDRYGHTISPLTGRPVQTDVLSATVLSSTAMEADAWATAFMAMGSGQAKEMALRQKMPVMLICSDTVWLSPKFETLIVK
ncbi:MAG: FAD:protein FMN transferase, partial [Muribaculaceae bacterium]|nr:FAD:protein FMN transferase [Muribaculaceae bacterium]